MVDSAEVLSILSNFFICLVKYWDSSIEVFTTNVTILHSSSRQGRHQPGIQMLVSFSGWLPKFISDFMGNIHYCFPRDEGSGLFFFIKSAFLKLVEQAPSRDSNVSLLWLTPKIYQWFHGKMFIIVFQEMKGGDCFSS